MDGRSDSQSGVEGDSQPVERNVIQRVEGHIWGRMGRGLLVLIPLIVHAPDPSLCRGLSGRGLPRRRRVHRGRSRTGFPRGRAGLPRAGPVRCRSIGIRRKSEQGDSASGERGPEPDTRRQEHLRRRQADNGHPRVAYGSSLQPGGLHRVAPTGLHGPWLRHRPLPLA